MTLDRRLFLGSALALGLPFSRAALAQSGTQGGPIVAPIRLDDRRITIEARLNGKGPFSFVIDTGAQLNAVRQGVADQVGLRKARDVRLNGGLSFPLYSVDELLLGGVVRQADAAMAGLPGARLSGDGLLAAGLLTTFDSELDLDRGQWRVWPSGSPDRTGFTRLDSSLREPDLPYLSRRIFAEITFNGAGLKPLLDTGSPNMLTLDHTVGRRLGLWSDTQPYVPVRTSGIGGDAQSLARLVRGKAIQVGPAGYEAPLIVVRPPDAQGPDAILGLPLLRTLDLSVDRAERAVWVRRNSQAPKVRTYGGSGLWLEAQGGGVTVAEVGTGSPAAKAGVRVGDVVEGLDFRTAIARLNAPFGETLALSLRRGGQAIPVSFVLADYL
ncbi:serine protease Do [Caulobacter ginsengisoli]|uniref:Serine protease Do n=1 Tax=Caulobacter ginsengisoli TaxID=400775 RepID=A0ABU0IV10_9CAUL|nr:aspartyl protease family protein [Caulobacter ginsengisoli]MDQ0465852.1 serine protease Do [Caulobacter ginsengisoli]